MIRAHNTIYAFETEAFEKVSGLSLCLEEPSVDPENPVVTGGPEDPRSVGPQPPQGSHLPRSRQWAGKICYTASVEACDGGYGMWFQSEAPTGEMTRRFAWSADGLTWSDPKTVGEGLFNSVGNSFNVYFDGERFLAPLTAMGSEVPADSELRALLPQDVGDARRRKMTEAAIAKTGRAGVVTFVGVATSLDGRRWSLPQWTPRLPLKLETPWVYRFRGRYIMNAQTNGTWFDPPAEAKRIVVFFTSDDLINWETEPHCMTNVAHESIAGQTHVGICPIKCIDDRLLIGLGGRFDDGHELTDQHFEITLLYSYDGLHWQPVAPDHERRSWIRRGRRGEWDFGGVAAMGMVEHGEEAAVYYAGTRVGNACHTQPLYDPGSCQVGRVRFGRDRFAGLQPAVGWKTLNAGAAATTAVGVITTKPVRLSPERPVTLNVDMPDDDSAKAVVEVLDMHGGVVESATVREGGVAVHVPIGRHGVQHGTPGESPQSDGQVPITDARRGMREARLRITLQGGPAPDRVPRLFAIEY